jgi:hypothetical protein
MSNLTQYLDQLNVHAKFFETEKYTLDTRKGRVRLALMLDNALSPENLSCDGEIRGAELRDKYEYLSGAARELCALDDSLQFETIF